ncbi:MAG: rhomboid family intramembrane serine protease [Nitriliruptoraceae bacterium]
MSDAEAPQPACFLHPGRPGLLRCSRCERPMCGADAIEAPVGYQCPECAQGAIPARRLRDLRADPRVTQVLLGAILVVFLLSQVERSTLFNTFGLVPYMVGDGAWWQLVTSGFLHANLMHVAFNAILLWRLGEMLESVLGHTRFAALYVLGLVGGSAGVLLLAWATVGTPLGSIPLLGSALGTHPLSVTVGASGAVFALMGAAVAGMRDRGVNPWRTDIGTLVLLNLVLTFLIPGISVGGHVGGLLAGMLGGRLLLRRPDAPTWPVLAVTAVLFAVSIGLGLGIAGTIQRLL